MGRKVEKHELYFEGRNLGCHLILMEKPLLWQRSLTLVYDIRWLTVFKPQLSLFPVHPQQLIAWVLLPLVMVRVKLSKPGSPMLAPSLTTQKALSRPLSLLSQPPRPAWVACPALLRDPSYLIQTFSYPLGMWRPLAVSTSEPNFAWATREE